MPTPPDAPVRWTAPAGCPDQARVQSQIDDLLGRPLDTNELRLDGVIEAAPNGWTLTLTTRVGTLVDQRTLDANDCSVLADAAALVAVVMLDPVKAADRIEEDAEAAEAARTAPAAEVRPPPTTPSLPEPDPDPPDDSTAPPPSQRSLGMSARVRGGGEFGAVPNGTGAFDLGIALTGLGRGGRMRAELLGQYSIGRDATSDNARTRIQLGAIAPRFCAALPAGPVDIPLCAGVELGAMRADTRAPSRDTTNRVWFAAHAEPGVRWSFSKRASLWVSAQVALPIAYPEFILEDPADPTARESVYRPQPVVARGLAGFEFRLFGGS